MTITIEELDGCEYTVDGEPYPNLRCAVHAWTDKGAGFHRLEAWRDGALVARLSGLYTGWIVHQFPLSK